MRVSKETAILLKEAGYDVQCGFAYPVYGNNTIAVRGIDWNNPKTTNMYHSAPTLHEAADWLRSKGVHVWVSVSHSWTYWQYRISFQWETHQIRSEYIFDTHDLAYEEGIVDGLKYLP